MSVGWPARARVVALAWLVVIAIYFPTFADMVRVWSTSSTFNHCFLILPIALYMAAQRRELLDDLSPGTSGWGIAFLLGNSLLWVAGDVMNLAFFTHLAVIGMLIGASWALLGNRVFGAYLFPFAFLYFAVPEGEFLVPYLQDWTAVVLVKMLQLTGLPVFIEGRYLAIPSGNFVVAEACSGINYLIATLAIGSMFMYLNFVSLWRRALFMLVAVAVPLVANGLRAYGIVMIAHLSGYKYALGIDHFIYGWVFFGLVIFALFALGGLFSDLPAATPKAEPKPPGNRLDKPIPAVLLVLLLASLAVPRGLLVLSDSARPTAPPIALPAIAGWDGPKSAAPALGTRLNGADAHLGAVYRNAEGQEVVVEISYLRNEQGGAELINQNNLLFDPLRWKQTAHRVRVPAATTDVREIQELTLREKASDTDFVLWSWYDTNRVRSTSRLPIKMAQGRARLAGHHAGGALVTVRTVATDSAQADSVLDAFLAGGSLALERLYQPE